MGTERLLLLNVGWNPPSHLPPTAILQIHANYFNIDEAKLLVKQGNGYNPEAK